MGLPADRVDRMEVYRCPLTYAHGIYVMSANRTITTLESTVVVLRTADGVSGYGEICPLGSTYLPSSAAGARAALREIAGAVVGQNATNIGKLHVSMDAALAGHGYARARSTLPPSTCSASSAECRHVNCLAADRWHKCPSTSPCRSGRPRRWSNSCSPSGLEAPVGSSSKLARMPKRTSHGCAAVVEATGEGDTIVADANGGWRLADSGPGRRDAGGHAPPAYRAAVPVVRRVPAGAAPDLAADGPRRGHHGHAGSTAGHGRAGSRRHQPEDQPRRGAPTGASDA